MHFQILTIVAGLVILVLGANLFVGGAAALARHYGVPPLLIGIVIVGFGTSMPEMLVSATASYRGTSGIALGNAYGSNITNILLILGVSAIIRPIRVTSAVISREMPILLAVTALAFVLLWDGEISRLDAAIMVVAFAIVLFISIQQSLKEHSQETEEQAKALIRETESGLPIREGSVKTAAASLIVGLALMLLSSEMLVRGAVAVAQHFGIGDLIIGLTIVAVGTSLPELASSVVAAKKGEDDLALGNILGSNVFNAMLVVGVAGLIRPLAADPELLSRDMPVMAAATVLLYIFCRGKKGAGIISRTEGVIFLILYVCYTGYLIHTAGVNAG